MDALSYEDPSEISKSLNRKIEKMGVKLAFLQRQCREAGIPVLIVVEGLSAAGKGTIINRMIQPLDPRGFKVTCIASPSRDEQLRPFLWRFWRRTPSADRMAIFDRSWYRNLLDARVNGTLSDSDLEKAYSDVRNFERQLRDGGTVIMKFFLEVSQGEQSSRLAALQENPATAWRVSEAVLERHNRYKEYMTAVDEMFKETNSGIGSSWVKVSSQNTQQATLCVLSNLVETIAARVKSHNKSLKSKNKQLSESSSSEGICLMPSFSDAPSLKNSNLSLKLGKEQYQEMLHLRQSKIQELHNQLYRLRIPIVMVYEGWDAAGKGGNIRRLTERMDPRGYEVIPVSAPNEVEKAHHYLWRFWTEFPKAGHVTIFDRSWYGRVLVERVEGFCKKEEWKRAYTEINEMEENFWNFGAVLVKFWIHIDKSEQMRRFEAREQNPHKKWKLNKEDWRNREKWSLYESAVEEMFLRTHTKYSPWTIIEGNCKRYARIKALDVTIAAIEKKVAQKSN